MSSEGDDIVDSCTRSLLDIEMELDERYQNENQQENSQQVITSSRSQQRNLLDETTNIAEILAAMPNTIELEN